jgi:hypothetical protein
VEGPVEGPAEGLVQALVLVSAPGFVPDFVLTPNSATRQTSQKPNPGEEVRALSYNFV